MFTNLIKVRAPQAIRLVKKLIKFKSEHLATIKVVLSGNSVKTFYFCLLTYSK